MKKIFSFALLICILLPLMGAFGINVYAAAPNPEILDGYENLCLTYTFRTSGYNNGRHYYYDLMPYVGYEDQKGNIKDFFFDSYLFLPCMDFGPSGARMHVDVTNPTKAIDWTTYVDDTFYEGTNVDALESAYDSVKSTLNNTDEKGGVFFTILYPCANARNFGSLGGKSLDFSNIEDRKYAIKWMIDEQMSRFNENNYQHLDLVGFYWLEEFVVSDDDRELLNFTSEYLHSLGLKFIWIPWYKANGYSSWKKLGFDAVCMQPNLYWMGNHDPNRVQESVNISNKHGMGMELELDSRVTSDDYFNRYLDYLEGGMNSGMMDSIKMYYQDGKPAVYYQAANSNDKRYRLVYDLTYKYAKKTLTQADIDAVRPKIENNYKDDIEFDKILWSGVNWVSVGKPYSGCRSYVDGNGMAYQDVDGKELTDGIIAKAEVSTDWHAFHTSIRDNDWNMSVTIDLQQVRNDLTNFAAHFDNRQDYGIGAPADINISISTDGVNFKTIASPELILDPVNSCINYECDSVTARYVKLSFQPADKVFVFCSEFLVGVKKEETDNIVIPDMDSPDTDNVDDSTDNKPLIITLSVVGIVLIITVITVVIVRIRRKNKCN